jgi:hypothetical protein
VRGEHALLPRLHHLRPSGGGGAEDDGAVSVDFGSNAEQAPTGRLVTAFAVFGATGGHSTGSGSSLTTGR